MQPRAEKMSSDQCVLVSHEYRLSFSVPILFPTPDSLKGSKVGRGEFSSSMASDEAFGEWEARTGDCRPPALVPPGQGLTVSAADSQAITGLALQGALRRLRQRRQDKPDPLAPGTG